MRWAPSRQSRAARVVALGCAAGAAVFAAENEDKIVPITRTPENTAISATRREFETIKSSRDPALQQKGDVPRLSVPEMPAASAGAGWTPPAKAIQEKKPNNWLVDTMEKQEIERRARARSDKSDRGERDALSRSATDPSRDGLSPSAADAASDAAQEGERKVPTTAVANPLESYLGGWMTPQDYALLKPSLAQGALPGGGRDPMSPNALQSANGALPGIGGTGAALGISAPAAGLPAPKAKENPFLQALVTPAPAVPVPAFGGAMPPATPAVKPLATAAPPPPPIEPAKSKIPDFAKPAEDEKYFKQLKRF